VGRAPAVTDLTALIDRASRWYRDDVAVVDGERRATFGDVADRSNRLANALGGLSPRQGARVGVLMPNRLEFVETDLAILKAGKVKVPINTRLADDEREYVLADSGADTLIYDTQFEEFVSAAASRLPDLRHRIAVDGREAGVLSYEEVLAKASARAPGLTIAADAPSFILYTSGTTGRPKGATATYASRLAATMNMLAEEIEAVRGDAMVHIGSMAHGSGSKTVAYYLRGARNITVRKFDPEAFLRLVESERATATFVVPTMIAMLLEAATPAVDLRSLKTVSYGGAPIAPALLQRALERFGYVFVQVYGSCEAPHPVMVMRKSDHHIAPGLEQRLASVGREVAMVDVRVMADGREAAEGAPGEMWVRGANVMASYWNKPEATSEVLQDGWYRSGDVCYRDEAGFYYIVDRARDMIISGGLNVYPAEVERALYAHPAVLEAAVLGVPDDVWGEAVKALIVLRPDRHATEDELIEHCKGLVAGYKKPRSVEFAASLPKGPTGKILKKDLQEKFWSGRARRVN
jgi:acyl-CoA synthetase (AMP-forming)/AMP-acid ligase II